MESDTDSAVDIQENNEPAKIIKIYSWVVLRPKNAETLFCKIIDQDPVEVMEEWFQMYRQSNSKATTYFIEFILEVAGYKHKNVNSFLTESLEVMNQLENNLHSDFMHYNGKHFLQIHNKTFRRSISKLTNFIENFVLKLHEENILSVKMIVPLLLNILERMSQSRICSMRHTGIFFASVFKTALIIVSVAIRSQSSRSPKESQALRYKQKRYKKYINFIDNNCLQNSSVKDYKLSQMKYHLITEMKKWIQLEPSKYVTERWIKFLIEELENEKKHVRYNALDVLLFALKYEECKLIYCSEYNDIICKRMRDIDIEVAVLATEILAYINENYFKLSEEINLEMCKHIYSNHYKIATTCGKYLVSKFTRNDSVQRITELLLFQKFAEKEKIQNSNTAFLIGSVFELMPELKNPMNFSIILHQTQCMEIERFPVILIEALKEITQLVLFQTPLYERKGFQNPKISSENIEKFLTNLLNEIHNLKQQYPISDIAKIISYIADYACSSNICYEETKKKIENMPKRVT